MGVTETAWIRFYVILSGASCVNRESAESGRLERAEGYVGEVKRFFSYRFLVPSL